MDRPTTNLLRLRALLVRLELKFTLVLIATCVFVAAGRMMASAHSLIRATGETATQVKGETPSATRAPQTVPRTPSETVRQFYQALREKKFKEAWALSIYAPALDGLKAEEYEDLRPDFERMALAVIEGVPANLVITGETISGESADVFVRLADIDGKPNIEPVGLMKVNGAWVVGKREDQALVKKAGKKFFFNARIDAHHADVQDMFTRISLALLLYSQQHNGKFANMQTLITLGLIPKDLESTASTGYRFNIRVAPDGKSCIATAEPAQYGRTGRLSFYMDAAGVRSADVGGKPLSPPKN